MSTRQVFEKLVSQAEQFDRKVKECQQAYEAKDSQEYGKTLGHLFSRIHSLKQLVAALEHDHKSNREARNWRDQYRKEKETR